MHRAPKRPEQTRPHWPTQWSLHASVGIALVFGVLMVGVLMVGGATRLQAQMLVDNPHARIQGEPHPTFIVSDLLPPEVVQTPLYQLRDYVSVRNYQLIFQLEDRRDSGALMTIQGTPMLELRLLEMPALQEARRLARGSQVTRGVLETVKNTPEGIAEVVKHPAQSLGRFPKGLGRVVTTSFTPRDWRAGGPTRRLLAEDLGCDPETSNPWLSPLLSQIATRRLIGSTGAKVGMTLGLTGLGMVPLNAELAKALANEPPHVLQRMLAERLIAQGAPEDMAQRFAKRTALTTYQRFLLAEAWLTLQDVNHWELLVGFAANTLAEPQGLMHLQAAYLLARLQEQSPIAQMSAHGFLTAELHDHRIIAVTGGDFFPLTNEFGTAILTLRKAYPTRPLEFLTTGQLSPDARRYLTTMGILVSELSPCQSITPSLNKMGLTIPSEPLAELP